MNKYYNETLGFYESPFFRLIVNTTTAPLDLNTMKEEDAAVFIHEYVHFLQAITTFYGLNQIHITVEYIRDANNWIYSHPKPSLFKVPIEPEESRCENVYYNWKIFELTQVDSCDCSNITLSEDPIESMDDISKNCPISQIKNITLNFKTRSDSNEFYSFGAICIMESMAYMLEHCISPQGTKQSPDLPYNSAMIVAKKIYPLFAQDPLNVLALCDLALQTSNPGHFFVCVLIQWKKRNKIPSKPEDLYDYFYNLSWKTSFKTGEIITQLTEMKNLVQQQLNEYFKPDKESNSPWSVTVNNIRAWINDILNFALCLRTSHKTFILDLAKGGNRTQNTMLQNIFNNLGVPFCINKSGEAFVYHKRFSQNRTNLDYFMAISQIYHTFKGSQEKCELFPLCKISGKKSRDELCNTPWLMYKTETNLCPYALMWHHWDLDGYTPDFGNK